MMIEFCIRQKPLLVFVKPYFIHTMVAVSFFHSRSRTQAPCNISICIHDGILHNHVVPAMKTLSLRCSIYNTLRMIITRIRITKIIYWYLLPDPVPQQQYPFEFICLSMKQGIELVFCFERIEPGQ